jgi:dCTP deaminase
MRICAFTFEELSSPAKVPYDKKKGSKYAGAQGPDASKLTSEN